jgi:hypothetical protein
MLFWQAAILGKREMNRPTLPYSHLNLKKQGLGLILSQHDFISSWLPSPSLIVAVQRRALEPASSCKGFSSSYKTIFLPASSKKTPEGVSLWQQKLKEM